MQRRHVARVVLFLAALATAAGTLAAPGAAGTSANPPRNTGEPYITGNPVPGHTLTAQTGTWSGDTPMSFDYRWRRCNLSGDDCNNIARASSRTYKVGRRDDGNTLRVLVTAHNSAGSGSALSNAVTVGKRTAPKNVSLPTISGSPVPGQKLTANPGTWTGAGAVSYTYGWRRCDGNGNHCSAIKDATARTYTVSADDIGHRLIIRVEARNSYGRTSKDSRPTSVVQAGAPVNTARPAISGSARQGATLSTTAGGWSSSVALAFYYQWARCDSAGNNCVPIPNAKQSTYTLTGADVGHRLIVQVKAQSSRGAGYSDSKPTAIVAASTVAPPPGSVPAASVSLPDRLVIDQVRFTPSRITTHSKPLIARFHVQDMHGQSVSGALVYAVAVPFNRLSTAPEARTDGTGWATIVFRVRPKFTLHKGYLIVMFVRARKPGGSILGGVSTRRLVSVHVG